MKIILLTLLSLLLFAEVSKGQDCLESWYLKDCRYIVKDVTNYSRYGSNEGNLMITPGYAVCSHTTHYHKWRITDSEGKVIIERDKDGLGGFGLGVFKPGNYTINGTFNFIRSYDTVSCGPPSASFSITEPPLDLTFSSISKDVTAEDCRSGSITTKITLDSWVNWKVNLLDSTKKVISSFKGKYYTYNGPYTKRVIDFPSVKNYTFDTLSAGTYRLELLADTCGEDGWRAQGQRIYPEYYENFDNCIAGSPYQEPNYTVIDSEKVIIKGPKCEIHVRVVDPNPLLVKEDGTLNTDVTEANKLKTEVKGAATDGVTKLLLIAETEKPVRFEIKGLKQGILSKLDGTPLTSTTDIPLAKDAQGKGFVVAVYTVPDGYGSEFAPGGRDAIVTISEKDSPSNAKEVKIKLVTPPVVLVHGMWSNPEAWLGKAGLVRYLQYKQYKNIQTANYSDNNYSTFHPYEVGLGVNSVYKSSIDGLLEYKNANIACTQVDVVAHSLGGLITRSFIQQKYYKNEQNFKKGYVHKLITIGTPHQGSPFGPLLYDGQPYLVTLRNSNYSTLLKYNEIFWLINKSIGTCHRDFNPSSDAYKRLERTDVKAHAITADFMPDNTYLYYSLDVGLVTLFNTSHSKLFKGVPSDVIVGVESQKGGLTSKGLSPLVPNTTHSGPLSASTETSSGKIHGMLIGLLSADTKDSELNSYFVDHFPAYVHPSGGRISTVEDIPMVNNEINAPLGDKGTEFIEITSPVRGTTYLLGKSNEVRLQFNTSGGAKPVSAVFMVQDVGWFEVPKLPPYTVSFILPKDAPIGRINIVAIARDETDLVIGDTTHINIATNIGVSNYEVSPNNVVLDSLFRKTPLYVSGTFINGQDTTYANLTNNNTGTTYRTKQGGNIVKVDANGVITAVKPGTDVIEVRYGNQMLSVAVTVSDNFDQSHYRTNSINFDKIDSKAFGDSPFAPNASATSGESVLLTLISGPATLVGGILTITGAGQVTIKASQAGNPYYKAAAEVTQTFTVKKASQTIEFNTVDKKTFGDAPFIISASANSQLPVIFNYVSGPAKLNGNTVTITGVGTVVIRGIQAGNVNYEAAQTDLSISVAKAAATIGINPASVIYDGTSKSISFNTSPTGLPVTVTYAGSNIAPVNAGTYAVVATINHLNYTGTANSILTIAKANQTLIFASLPNKTYGDPAFNLSATSNSGLTANYSIVEGATSATLNGAQLTITGVGQVTIRVTQPGTENYNAAIPVERTFTIAKANQTIVFNALTDKTFGDVPFTLAASASSTLPVSFSKVSGPITLDGAKVTITGAGSVTLRALQAGNATHNVAPSVDRIFVVRKANQTITFDVIEDKIANDSSFTLTAITTSGLLVSFSKVSGPVNLFGNTVVISGPGKAIIRASQAGESNYNSAPDVERSFTINAVTGLEAQLEKQIKIYPNPASTQVIIKFPLTIQWQGIIITSIQGKQVEDIEEKPTQHVILAVGHLARGMYILEIRTSQGIIHKRLVVE